MPDLFPARIQLRRTKGWRKPDGAVSVARGTMWSNPFRVGQRAFLGLRMDEVEQIDQSSRGVRIFAFDPPIPLIPFPAPLTIEDVLGRYRAHILETAGLTTIRNMLRGKTLACWCPLTLPDGSRCPCHADTLIAIANA